MCSSDLANSGALTLAAGIDVPSVYVFRGILQEVEPRVTVQPFGRLAVALHTGQGLLRSAEATVGVWHSVHTGTSGSRGPTRHAHLEEDFSAGLSLAFGGGITVSTAYSALTSPNQLRDTIKELQLGVSTSYPSHPYALIGVELTDDGQADLASPGPHHKGRYLEVEIGRADV